MKYDNDNIFAKILRGEIPCKKIFENEFVLSFYDINPQKKIHALIIPKGPYIDLDDFIKNVTGTATSGSAYLGAPTDFLAPFSLAVIDSSSNYNYLKLKHPSFIRDYTPASSTTGEPKYYAEFDDNTFILAPTPNSNYTFELHYFYRPSSLTSAGDSGTTWLSTNAPNAMLYGALAEAMVYLKNFEYSLT